MARKKISLNRQESEQNSEKIQNLKLSDKKFEITMINILSIRIEKVDNMQEQTGAISKDMEASRKKEKRNARNFKK